MILILCALLACCGAPLQIYGTAPEYKITEVHRDCLPDSCLTAPDDTLLRDQTLLYYPNPQLHEFSGTLMWKVESTFPVESENCPINRPPESDSCPATPPAEVDMASIDAIGIWLDSTRVVIPLRDIYAMPKTPGLWEYRCVVDTVFLLSRVQPGRFPTPDRMKVYHRTIDTTCVWERHVCEAADSVLIVTPGHWEFEWSDPIETKGPVEWRRKP